VSGRQDSRATADGSTTQTPEQRRAADALRTVRALENADDAVRKRYRAYADRVGPSILMNGLGQALATERAAAGSNPQKADERAHDRLYRNIEAWLCRVGGVYEPSSDQDPDLLKAIVQGGEADYLRAQAEVLAWLVWHKKFCRAYLPAAEDEEI
jgi:CRISPR-associated protein Cmr5